MNYEKRRVIYQKVKNYVKYRKKDIRFPFHPSCERSTDFRNDLRMLEENDYDLGQVRQSDIWCQRYDKEEAVDVVTLKPNELWDFLYSDHWCGSSSVRICEGALLDLLLESLYLLENAGSLSMYRMARFDDCEFLCPRTANKLLNQQFPAHEDKPVKITFTFFWISIKSWNTKSETCSSLNSQDPFHIIVDSENEDNVSPAESGSERLLSKSASKQSGIQSRMMNCRSDTGRPSFLATSQHTLSSSVRSDPSVNTVHSVIRPLEFFKQRVMRMGNTEQTPVNPSTASVKRPSTQFKPSHESVEENEIVFEDTRYYKEWPASPDSFLTGFFTLAKEPESQINNLPSISIDTAEPIAEPNRQSPLAMLKAFPYNNRYCQSPHPMTRSPAHKRIRKSRTHPRTRPKRISSKMHPDKAALAYKFCGEESTCTSPARKRSPEENLNKEEVALQKDVEPLRKGDTGITPCIKVKKKGKILPRKVVRQRVVNRGEQDLQVDMLVMSHSIDQLRLTDLKRKVTFRALTLEEKLQRKYIATILEAHFKHIYGNKGLIKESKPPCPIHLFNKDQYVMEKITRVEEYRKSKKTRSDKDEPLFSRFEAESFQKSLLRAAKDFLIRKEQVTCTAGQKTITSVTFNRIVPCRYNLADSLEECYQQDE